MDHFVSSPREREKRDRRDRKETKEKDRSGKENECQQTNSRNKNIPPLPLPAARIAGLAQL